MEEQQFKFIDTQGKSQTINASSADDAMRRATNIAPNSGVQQLSGVAPISMPFNSNNLTPQKPVDLPQPKAPKTQESFLNESQQQLQTSRQRFETELSTRKKDTEKKLEIAKEKEKELLAKGEPLTEAFREDLEKTERERLYVNENFEANQRLTTELEQLLTEGNELIRMQQGRPVALSVVQKNTQRAIRDVEARAGVIQAVMSARNNQINSAYTMIDRTVSAINADRQDQLSYLNTLLDLNSQNVLTLEGDIKSFAESELKLIEEDMNREQAVADHIKSLMIDPNTAQFIADAGVSLTDSIDEINEKMAEQSKVKERTDMTNELVLEGYTPVAFPTSTEGLTTIEAGGKTLYFKPPADKTTSGSGTIKFSSTQTRDLIGAGFSSDDVSLIQQSINENGIAATLSAIDNLDQRAAVASVMNADGVLSSIEAEPASVEETIDDIIKTATDDQIKKLKSKSDDAGTSSFWSGKKSDVKRLLNTPEMQQVIQNAISQGLTPEDILNALLM